jgi:hypothetical protein
MIAPMDYEGFFRERLDALRAEGGIAFSPISSGAAAGFREPSITASAPR